MRVICINDKIIDHANVRHVNKPFPVIEGDIYTVLYSGIDEDGIPEYFISEVGTVKCQQRFIPLSEISETEMERNYEKQLA